MSGILSDLIFLKIFSKKKGGIIEQIEIAVVHIC